MILRCGELSTKMAVHKIMAVTEASLQRLQRQKTQQLSSDFNSVKHSVSPSLYNLLRLLFSELPLIDKMSIGPPITDINFNHTRRVEIRLNSPLPQLIKPDANCRLQQTIRGTEDNSIINSTFSYQPSEQKYCAGDNSGITTDYNS